MSVDDGSRCAARRYASRAAGVRTAPCPARAMSTFDRSVDDAIVSDAAMIASAMSLDFTAKGTATSSTFARSVEEGIVTTVLKNASRSAASLRPRYRGARVVIRFDLSVLLGIV